MNHQDNVTVSDNLAAVSIEGAITEPSASVEEDENASPKQTTAVSWAGF